VSAVCCDTSSLGLDLGITRPCSWPASFKEKNRNFAEKRLTGEVFLDVAEPFDILWIDGLLLQANDPKFLDVP
jgi:hypothetical protein